MGDKTVREYTYTKDNGEVSQRVLYDVSKPARVNVRALDLSGVDENDYNLAISLYEGWLENVEKKRLEEIKAVNRKYDSLKFYFETRLWNGDVPQVKTFHFEGLKEKYDDELSV